MGSRGRYWLIQEQLGLARGWCWRNAGSGVVFFGYNFSPTTMIIGHSCERAHCALVFEEGSMAAAAAAAGAAVADVSLLANEN